VYLKRFNIEPLPAVVGLIKPVENLAKRKESGGRRRSYRGRRAFERDRYASETTLGERMLVKKKVRGGNLKLALRRVDYANVSNPSTGETSKVKILKVLKNPASGDYERRGVITRGAVIETEVGVARVVSRPGQNGLVNAVLTESR